MYPNFTAQQQKTLLKFWMLGAMLLFISIVRYYVEVYTPDTSKYIMLWNAANWALYSTALSWYFYRNNKSLTGIIVQISFVPYFIFRNNLSLYIDYNFEILNSRYIYNMIDFITFTLPVLYFTKAYFTAEKSSGAVKVKFIWKVIGVLVLISAMSVDSENVTKYFSFFSFNSVAAQDGVFIFVQVVNTLKILCLLMGFFYLSNRMSEKRVWYALDLKFISPVFFKWGFIISFTLLFLMLINLTGSIFSLSVFSQKLDAGEIVDYFSALAIILVAGRFLGSLVQYRNFSQRRYLGILNSMVLLPLLNLLPFFLMLFLKKSAFSVDEYIKRLRKNKLIHLSVYCGLLIVFAIYRYFKNDGEDNMELWKILIYVPAILLVANYRKATRWVPFIIVAILYFSDLKYFFNFSDGVLDFFTDNVLSFKWLSIVALCAIYYITYYILHKAFYTSFFETKDEDSFKSELEYFE